MRSLVQEGDVWSGLCKVFSSEVWGVSFELVALVVVFGLRGSNSFRSGRTWSTADILHQVVILDPFGRTSQGVISDSVGRM